VKPSGRTTPIFFKRKLLNGWFPFYAHERRGRTFSFFCGGENFFLKFGDGSGNIFRTPKRNFWSEAPIAQTAKLIGLWGSHNFWSKSLEMLGKFWHCSDSKLTSSQFIWSKQKWLFWRADFYPSNQNNLKSFQKAVIGWKKAGTPKKPLLFWSCKQANHMKYCTVDYRNFIRNGTHWKSEVQGCWQFHFYNRVVWKPR